MNRFHGAQPLGPLRGSWACGGSSFTENPGPQDFLGWKLLPGARTSVSAGVDDADVSLAVGPVKPTGRAGRVGLTLTMTKGSERSSGSQPGGNTELNMDCPPLSPHTGIPGGSLYFEGPWEQWVHGCEHHWERTSPLPARQMGGSKCGDCLSPSLASPSPENLVGASLGRAGLVWEILPGPPTGHWGPTKPEGGVRRWEGGHGRAGCPLGPGSPSAEVLQRTPGCPLSREAVNLQPRVGTKELGEGSLDQQHRHRHC